MTISVMADRRRLRKMLRKARVASMCVLLCGDGLGHQRAVAHAKAARRARDEGGVVRGEDEGGVRLGVEPLQKVEDLRSGLGVEVGGRFVGENELRIAG